MKPMERRKGIVMRIDKQKMVVLTDAGDFLSVPVPKNRPYPGQTVDVPVSSSKSLTRIYGMAIAAAILILVLSLTLLKPLLVPQAVAAVAMDLTSSVELSIDEQNRVIKATALNPEGSSVLQELDLQGEDIYRAVNMVALKAADLGYLRHNAENTIIVTVTPLRVDQVSVDRDRLQQTMHNQLARLNYQGYLVVNQAGAGMRSEARRRGLTVNQYLLWERSQAQGAEISINELKYQPLDKLVADDEAALERMFPGMWCRVGGMVSRSGPVQPDLAGEAGPQASPATSARDNEDRSGMDWRSGQGRGNPNCGPQNWSNSCGRW